MRRMEELGKKRMVRFDDPMTLAESNILERDEKDRTFIRPEETFSSNHSRPKRYRKSSRRRKSRRSQILQLSHIHPEL